MFERENFDAALAMLNGNAHRDVIAVDWSFKVEPRRVPELETGRVKYMVPGELSGSISFRLAE